MTYRVEMLFGQNPPVWALAMRARFAHEPRAMSYGAAQGLTLEDARNTFDILDRTGAGVRIVEEESLVLIDSNVFAPEDK